MHLVHFLPLFTRETTFVNSCLFSCDQTQSEKGSKFFLFRVDPFSEGMQTILSPGLSPLYVYVYPLSEQFGIM